MNVLAHSLAPEQFDELMAILRNNLVLRGMDGDRFDKALAEAVDAVLNPTIDAPVFSPNGTPAQENRGVDCLGRILVEYCFFKACEGQMLWPNYSEQDMAARKAFVAGIIPRPIMRYFLASVRGSISELDRFENDATLLPSTEKHIKAVESIIEEHKGPFGKGEDAVQWDSVYDDQRSRKAALLVIGEILEEIGRIDADEYLSSLERLRRKDPDAEGINAMQRPINKHDITQLVNALNAAASYLDF